VIPWPYFDAASAVLYVAGVAQLVAFNVPLVGVLLLGAGLLCNWRAAEARRLEAWQRWERECEEADRE
jgi:hypothetical protein